MSGTRSSKRPRNYRQKPAGHSAFRSRKLCRSIASMSRTLEIVSGSTCRARSRGKVVARCRLYVMQCARLSGGRPTPVANAGGIDMQLAAKPVLDA